MFALAICATAFGAGELGERVTFTTSDGVTIVGTFVKGKLDKGGAVLLVHMLGRTRQDWDPILKDYLLPETPYSYLAIDMRGHGESTQKEGKTISFKNFSENDWRGIMTDIAAAVKYLRSRGDVNGDKIAIVGASIGANAALNYALGDPRIAAIALLSPAFDYHSVGTLEVIGDYTGRPIFMAASQDDLAAYGAVKQLRGMVGDKVTARIFPGNLHGTKMFGPDPIAKPLVAFLKESLGK